jgi:hypothetical protein
VTILAQLVSRLQRELCLPLSAFICDFSGKSLSIKGVRTLFWGVELREDAELGRPKRADEAGGMDHSLNRGKVRLGGTPRGFAMGVACCANYPALQSILPNSQTVTMLLCREQLYLAPKRTIARPSKTRGRATRAIQSSIHPGRANPTRVEQAARLLNWAS